MKKIKLGLLPKVLIAIALGVGLGFIVPEWFVRASNTFNAIFGQLLGFMIPLIIVGLVTAAIGELGKGAGKMLLVTVLIAYLDTVFASLGGFAAGSAFFPSVIGDADMTQGVAEAASIQPFFSINIPPLLDVMSALVFSFIMGLCLAKADLPALRQFFREFKEFTARVISKLIIPVLPFYIFSIFLDMAATGKVFGVLKVFAFIILFIFILHFLILLYEFLAAGAIVRRNPFVLLWNMLPAYITALGTSSSAATIPVTLQQCRKNGVDEDIAGFSVPLCATIHMPGSAMKITCCAVAVALMGGRGIVTPDFLEFVFMLGIMMVAAPGVPGGAIMAALAPLGSILGFGAEEQALMIALYIAMDSFGTACNVTGDGAVALVIQKLFRRSTPQQVS